MGSVWAGKTQGRRATLAARRPHGLLNHAVRSGEDQTSSVNPRERGGPSYSRRRLEVLVQTRYERTQKSMPHYLYFSSGAGRGDNLQIYIYIIKYVLMSLLCTSKFVFLSQ